MNKRFLWIIFTSVAVIALSAFAVHAIQTERVLTDLGRNKVPNVSTVSAGDLISPTGTAAERTSDGQIARRAGTSLPITRVTTPDNSIIPATSGTHELNRYSPAIVPTQREINALVPVPMPANTPQLNFNLGPESDDRGRNTLDARCVLTTGGITPYYIMPGLDPGNYVKVWFTPRQCGTTWTPFRIDSVEFAIYSNGAGTLVFGVDIECPLTPYDSTTGPAYPLSNPDSNWYSMTFPTGGGWGWMKVNVNLDVCVNHGFFAGLRFDSWSGNSADFPTFLWDSSTPLIAQGKQWVCTPGCCDWRNFIGSGRVLARVYGNTVDGCTPVACSTTAPCVVTCLTGDSVEAPETADSVWMSTDPNGGCFSTPPSFGSMACGQWVCGKLFTYTGDAYYHRDFDWYTFTLTARDSVRLTVISEFPVLAGIADTGDCVTWDFLAFKNGTQNICTTRVTTACLDPGTYAVLVSPASFYCPVAPGADYRATIECFECQPCTPPVNDECVNATTITCPATDVQVDLSCATLDCDSLTNPEVWYKFYLDPAIHSAWTLGVSWCGTDPNIISIGAVLYSACPCSGSFGYTGSSSFNCGSPSWLPDTLYFENVPAGWWYMPVYTSLGTTAVFDLSCEEYLACSPVSPNDNCADVSAFTLPATFTENNRCATHDCANLTEGQGETWHAFTIDTQCNVIIDYCGTNPAFVIFYTILYQSCPCTTAIAATTTDFTTCGDDNITMRFDYLQPGTYYLPVMRSDLDSTGGPYTIHVYCAPTCSLTCPTGALIENEPVCSADFIDFWNGGCLSDPDAFTTITCGQTVCGHSGTFVVGDTTRGRDTDWYRLNLTERAYIQWTAVAQFPVALMVMDSTNCDSLKIISSIAALTCDTANAVTALLDPGQYWLFIAPNQFEYVDCGVEYVAWVTCTPCSVTCLATDVIECAETPDPAHLTTDCNGGCSIDPAQYQEIACGQSICGVGFTYDVTDTTYARDRDWYHFTLTDTQIVSATLEAEFPADLYILNYDCNNIVVLEAVTSETPCTPLTLVTASALPPGDYTLYVAPAYDWVFSFDGWATYPSRYRVTLGCPCPPPINTTVYLNTGMTNLVVRWVAPAPGAYKIFSTIDKTISFDPVTWFTETTVTASSGLNSWIDPAAPLSYKRYVVQRVCQ